MDGSSDGNFDCRLVESGSADGSFDGWFVGRSKGGVLGDADADGVDLIGNLPVPIATLIVGR